MKEKEANRPLRKDILGRIIKEGDFIIILSSGSTTPIEIIKIEESVNNDPTHPQGDLHLKGYKPLLWISGDIKIVDKSYYTEIDLIHNDFDDVYGL